MPDDILDETPDIQVPSIRRRTPRASTAISTTRSGYGGSHSFVWRRHLLNLITDAMGVNAMSMHVNRQGLAPPIAA